MAFFRTVIKKLSNIPMLIALSHDIGVRGVWLELKVVFRHKCTALFYRRFHHVQSGNQLTALNSADQGYAAYLASCLPDEKQTAVQHSQLFSHALSLLIPTYNTDPKMLGELLDSILAQTCPHWEVCIYDGASTRPETLETLRCYAETDDRIRVTFGQENGGISANTNRALDMARYDWCALVDHDDLLTPDAVYRILLQAEGGADMVYSDEDKVSEDGTRFYDPRLKPAFSPELLRSTNYICHLTGMKTALMRSLGGLRPAFDGSQDHDLVLRASEHAQKIVHIPYVLYHWRQVSSSASHQKAHHCADMALNAVREHAQRLNLPGKIDLQAMRIHWHDAIYPQQPIVVLFQPNARALRHLERVLPPNSTVLTQGSASFTFRKNKTTGFSSATLNRVLSTVSGDVILFLHSDVKIAPQCIPQLYLFARQHDIACAGAVLQRNAMVIENAGWAFDSALGVVPWWHDSTPYASPLLFADRANRNVSAVSRSCMMIRRRLFLSLGGFECINAPEGDLLLGLKAHKSGLRCVSVWDAQAKIKPASPVLCPAPDSAALLSSYGVGPVDEEYLHPMSSREYAGVMPDFLREVL